MDFIGIGVLLMGIACLVLAIYLARVLNNFANVISGVDKTVEQLPEQLDNILNETGNLIHHSNETLSDVNEKLGTLTPIFHIVGDIGESTRTLSSSLVDVTKSAKRKLDKTDPEVQKKRLGGVYGSLALSHYLYHSRQELKKGFGRMNKSKLYRAGERKALVLEEMKADTQLEATKNSVL